MKNKRKEINNKINRNEGENRSEIKITGNCTEASSADALDPQ